MSTSQRIETDLIWNTDGVDRGQKRVEAALERMGKAEERSGTASASREARDAQRTKMNRERALKDLERLEIESARRRAAATDQIYRQMDKAAALRQAALVNTLRRSGSGGAGGMGGYGHGGAGGHGGGAGGGSTSRRMAGDLLNAATGSSGNVMRLNMLSHMGVRVGGGVVAAGLLGKGAEANNENFANTRALQKSIGERVASPWSQNSAASGILRMLPSWMTAPETMARAATRSHEGMSAQREEIAGGIEKAREGRSYMATVGSTYGAPFSGHDRMGESFKAEIAGQNKLLELDGRIAEKIKLQTAARREGVFESEHEAKLAEARLTAEERIASLDDQFNAGKIGAGERMAGVAGAQSARDIAEFQAGQERLALNREIGAVGSETYIRGRGQNVASRSAFSRFKTANSAFGAAQTVEQRAKADGERSAAYQDYSETERAERSKFKTLDAERAAAEFRGGAEARSLHHAEHQLSLAEQLLDIAKEAGADAEREATVRVASARLALDLTRQELAARRIDNTASTARGNIAGGTARFALGQATGSQNGNIAFAAGQAVSRSGAAGAVSSASLGLAQARARVESEIAIQGQASESALQSQVEAQQALNQAKTAQLHTERDLAAAAVQRERGIATAARAARAESAAMRIANTGRTDRADLSRSRSASEAQALEFQRAGRPDLAAEVQEQQRLREVGLYDDKFLRPDGRRRRGSTVQREERIARRNAGRRSRANSRLEGNGGLQNVHRGMNGEVLAGTDPLTRERVSPEELYQRKQRPGNQAAAELSADSMSLAKILAVLEKRLPATTL